MKNRIRVAILGGSGLLLVVGAGILYWNWQIKQPLYQFGDVSAGRNLRAPLEPPVQNNESVWTVEPDIQLSFDFHGEGESVLVIHGGPGIPYPSDWKGLQQLSRRYKFYYYHQRGCGNSTRPFDRFDGSYYANMITLERTLGVGAQIADIERVRQILGQEKMTLIGHSFGGFIAALYAAEFPDRVEKLVLVAPAGVLTPPDEERDLFLWVRTKLNGDDQTRFDGLLKRYLDFGNIFSKSESELVELHGQLGDFILKAMGNQPSERKQGPRSGGWAVFALYFSIGRAQDYRPALTQISAPTLIVIGAEDELAVAGSETYLLIPNSKLVSVKRDSPQKRSGHFIYDDSPAAFEQAVQKFLEE